MGIELRLASDHSFLNTMQYKEEMWEQEFGQWNSCWFSHTSEVSPETAELSAQNTNGL